MKEVKRKRRKQTPHLRLYLYNLRKKSGMSVYEVTTELALSKPYYYQIEQGKKGHKMDVVFLNDLAMVFKAKFETLCQGELLYQMERRELGIRHEPRLEYFDELQPQ